MDIRTVSCTAGLRGRFILLTFSCLALGLATVPVLGQASVEGEWSAPVGGFPDGVQEPEPADYGWPFVTMDAALLSTGKVLVWEANEEPHEAKLWNPTDGSWTEANCNVCVGSLHCRGHAFLADGSLLAAGGGLTPPEASAETRIFRLSGLAPGWATAEAMAHHRWYPTSTTLPDGRVLTVAGTDGSGVTALTPEVYNPLTDTWDQLTNPEAQTTDIAKWYPFMFVLPDGKVFYAGGSNATSPPVKTYTLDMQSSPPVWAEFPSGSDSFFGGKKGAAVMYEPGKILKAGGVDAAGNPINQVAKIEIDADGSTTGWELLQPASFLPEARKDHHLVLLPDGKILLVGGHDGANYIKDARMFDPQLASPEWVNMADMVKQRGHHAVALLLPDATVLSAGGDGASLPANPDKETAEIYEPPYLHTDQPRPKIGFAPTFVPYNVQFNVVLASVPGLTATDIEKVTLVRPGSVTHWFDSDQRFQSLVFEVQGLNTLKVTSPLNGNEAPPGYYMLFVVSESGVPSVAAWVRVDDSVG